jgi:hypothetical protein
MCISLHTCPCALHACNNNPHAACATRSAYVHTQQCSNAHMFTNSKCKGPSRLQSPQHMHCMCNAFTNMLVKSNSRGKTNHRQSTASPAVSLVLAVTLVAHDSTGFPATCHMSKGTLTALFHNCLSNKMQSNTLLFIPKTNTADLFGSLKLEIPTECKLQKHRKQIHASRKLELQKHNIHTNS